MTVVAIVPAKDRADRVGATVAALAALPRIDRILVVDDGSTDDTGAVALGAGAEVLRLPVNRGKAGAIRAGVEATPDAEVYLLIDADVADTAAAADALLDPVLAGRADLTVGTLPPAAGRGGFGTIKKLAGRGVEAACGVRLEAPLSGQRAVRADLLRAVGPSTRFGLEVAMTIDVVRAGGRVVEVPVPMEHRHTGRSVAGFRHRAGQGRDILIDLWPRLVAARVRRALLAATTVAVVAAMLLVSAGHFPTSVPAAERPDRVVVFGIPHWSLEDVGEGTMPAVDRLVQQGALAAMSARTASGRPRIVEAYATLGSGVRVRAGGSLGAAFARDARLEGSSAAEVTARRTGVAPTGEIVVPSIGAAVEAAGEDLSSTPGALGSALHAAGLTTAVIGSGDRIDVYGELLQDRPAAAAAVDESGSVDVGAIDGATLLESAPGWPYGVRSDHAAVLAELGRAFDRGVDFVVVDPGDTDRAGTYGTVTTEERAEQLRVEALGRTDALVEQVVDAAGAGSLVLVVGMVPPSPEWELTPILAVGRGVTAGHLHSNSTKRPDLVTLTDVAPTVLEALGVEVPDGMIGRELRYRSGSVEVDRLEEANETAVGREGIYFPIALTFIIVQALTYLLLMVVLSQDGPGRRARQAVRLTVLTFAAWPLATFLMRIVPATYQLGGLAHALLWAMSIAIALVADRARRHPMQPLLRITAATVVVMVLDITFGAELQMSSILGYSPHTAARFTGFGNTAFAVLAATATVTAAVFVHYSGRPRDALWSAAAVLVVVLVADAAPTLGSDVGGILTLVPVFGLVVFAMSGRRVAARQVILAGVATAVAVVLFAVLDVARGPEARTHLGDFVAGIFEGDGTFWTTISRKWATNLRVFRRSIWTWMVPIISVFGVYILVYGRGWRKLLPPGSAIRAGVIGTLGAGMLGWLVNDSGVVVTALIFVYVGPYLTLLRLAPEDEPIMLPASEPVHTAPEPS